MSQRQSFQNEAFSFYRRLSTGGPARCPTPGSCRGMTGTRRGTSGGAEGWTGAPRPLPSERNPAAESKAKKKQKQTETTEI